MNSILYLIFVATLFLLLKYDDVHCQPVNTDIEHKWNTGYYPFPEMSRFLNSHSRIHRKPAQASYSFLGYLCSMANDKKEIEELLNTFDGEYSTLIMTIIEQDCPKHAQKRKRMIKDDEQNELSRLSLRTNMNYFHKI